MSDHDLIIEQLNLIMELTAQLDAAQNRVEELEQAHEVMDDFCKLSDLALRVDASNPTLPGAFTGTVSERLTRQFDYLSETQTNGSAWKSSESCSIP